MRDQGTISFGTCSWKCESWKGILYPVDGKFNYLEEYSKHFSTVEVDQWFWSLHRSGSISLPREKDVMEYASVVPANFRFSVKAPNSITLTHYYSNDNTPAPPNPSFLSAALAQEFLNSLAPMNPFLGPVMFQFGYLNKSMIASRNEFFTRLKEFIQTLPPSYLYAVETRNPNYLLGDYFELLLEHSLVPVFLQGYYMPPIFPLIKKFGELLPKTVVIRLHGPDRPGIEERTGGKWDRIIEPKDDELMPLVQTLSDLLVAKKEVYVNVNNHYEGSAPLTINRIRELMDREGLSY